MRLLFGVLQHALDVSLLAFRCVYFGAEVHNCGARASLTTETIGPFFVFAAEFAYLRFELGALVDNPRWGCGHGARFGLILGRRRGGGSGGGHSWCIAIFIVSSPLQRRKYWWQGRGRCPVPSLASLRCQPCSKRFFSPRNGRLERGLEVNTVQVWHKLLHSCYIL